MRPEGKSERLVVAKKEVMILEQRGLTVNMSLNNGVSRFNNTTE